MALYLPNLTNSLLITVFNFMDCQEKVITTKVGFAIPQNNKRAIQMFGGKINRLERCDHGLFEKS